MQHQILPTEDIAGIHRFALLLAGAPGAAQSIVLEVFADAGEKIHHFRSGKSCKAWLVAKVRSRLVNKTLELSRKIEQETAADPAAVENFDPALLDLSARFSRITEPGRSALALLYIGQFSVQEIAQILQLSLEELAAATDAARAQLQKEPAQP